MCIRDSQTTGGIALGVMDEMPFETSTLTLSKGDSIYLYTDGVNEAMNEKDEEYSYERLEAFLIDSTEGSVSETVEASLNSVKVFAGTAPQSDDITVLVIKYAS